MASISDYRCDSCNRYSEATQSSRLTAVPDILEIELLRFSQLRPGIYKKNSKTVSFDQDLDLTAFSETNITLQFRLLSVVQHLGSYDTGHYRCIAKSPDGTWEDIDDSTVSKAHIDTALDPSGNWTPYTLFYARVDVSGASESEKPPHFSNTSAYNLSSENEHRIHKKRQLINGISKPAHKRPHTETKAVTEAVATKVNIMGQY